jgi:propanol-preferring alcohol dehydrogenase
MKAWQFSNTNEPLVRVELPDPVVGPGEVVVRVRAAGLCHTDVGVLRDKGWLSTLAYRPIVLGHEVAGEVAEVGDDVTGWAVGDRVGVCPTTSFGAPGFVTDGGLRREGQVPRHPRWYRSRTASRSHSVPAGTDAGMTSHAAVISNGQVKSGDKVGIIGFGGLGQIGARVAVLAGANVYVAEVNESIWDNIRATGVKRCRKVHPRTGRRLRRHRRLRRLRHHHGPRPSRTSASAGVSSRSAWAPWRPRSRPSGSS